MREGSGIAGTIAGLLVGGFALLPALLVLVGSLFLFGYAIVRMATGGGMSAHAVVVGTVLIATAFPLITALAAGLLGRGLSPPRREEP